MATKNIQAEKIFNLISSVIVNFGSLPKESLETTVYSEYVKEGAKITAELAYSAPSSKDLDEITMDKLYIICGEPTDGSFQMVIEAVDGSYLSGEFIINYSVSF